VQPDFVVLVVVGVVTVSVLPTLQPEATSAANKAAESVSVLLLCTIEFIVLSHAMMLFLF
jgi:type II secretory pathway pseudopilin PulG